MDLLFLIKHDDETAFGSCFDQYHNRLFFFFRQKTGSAFLAEELVQLTFIKLWNSRKKLDDHIALHIQLFRIARTTLIDMLRTEAVAHRRMDRLKEQLPEAIEIPAFCESKETMERLQSAIDKLPAARGRIFRMSRLDGLSYKEIAGMLQISPRTVEHQVSHAVKQLRELLSNP